MQIKTSELKDILRSIKPGLATKAIVEQATHFVFSGEDVFTYNDKISISFPLDTDFECSVPADLFYGIVMSLTAESTEMELKDNQLMLTCGTTKAGINISTDQTLLDLVKDIGFPDDEDWMPLEQEVIRGLSLCMFSASKDISHPYMTCVSVEGNRIVSGDDIRISLFSLKKGVDKGFLLPAKSAEELVKFDIIEYAVVDRWIFFGTNDGVIFCSRIVLDDYPDVTEFFEMEGKPVQIPGDLLKNIEVINPMVDGDFDIDKEIEIAILSNIMKCRTDGKGGWIESSRELEGDIPDLTFKVNPIFMAEILGKDATMIHDPGKLLIASGELLHLMSLPL
jgi:hypothetical protein